MKFILILFFSTSLFAQDFTLDKESGKAIPNFIGQLKLHRGKVYRVNKQGSSRAVEIGTRFNAEDALVTKEKSSAKVLMVDDTIISVGPNSEIKFSEFKFVEKTNRKSVYELKKGQLTGNVRNKAKPGDVVFRTRLTTMGIRGTDILMNHRTVNNLEISEIAMLSGSAEVTEGDKKHDLKKADKLIVVQDNKDQKIAHEKMALSGDELRSYSAQDKNPETEMRPFMPYFEPEKVTEDSSLYSFLHRSPSAGKEDHDSTNGEKLQEEKKGWKHNLHKLNEKLQETFKRK